MLVMPFCVKIIFEIDKEDNWLTGLETVNEFFMDKDIPDLNIEYIDTLEIGVS